MTDYIPNIVEQLDREWRELGAGIRQRKMEQMFMQVLEASSQLTDAERAEALATHDQTDADFIAAIEGLNDAQWAFRPGANRWSIQETAEHIVLVAAMLGSSVEQTLAQGSDPNLVEPEGAYERMRILVLDRSFRGMQAPPPVSPHGHPANDPEHALEIRGDAVVFQRSQSCGAFITFFSHCATGTLSRRGEGPRVGNTLPIMNV